MIDIPTTLQPIFDTQQGAKPQFIVAIDWETTGLIEYGTREFDTWTVYPYVEVFESYESVSQVSGLGEVSSISPIFNDFYGHMKQMLDDNDIFDEATLCTVYLTVVDGTQRMKLFEGRIQDPLIWEEDGKKLRMTIISSSSEGLVGYAPSADDIDDTEPLKDYYDDFLTGYQWPEVFGHVFYYPLAKISERSSCESVEDAPYTLGQDDIVIPVENLGVFETDDPGALPEIFVNLVGSEQGKFSLIAEGSFKTKAQILIDFPSYTGEASFGFVITDATDASNKITDKWYTNIPFEYLDTSGLGEEVGDEADDPPTRIRLLLGDDYPAPAPSPTPKAWDEVPIDGATDDAFIQFMVSRVSYDLSGFGTLKNNVKVVDQTGNICTLDRHIIGTAGTVTNGVVLWSKKTLAQVYKIPAGTRIYDMDDTEKYVLDLKENTVIQDVFIDTGDGFKAINQSRYSVKNNTATTTAASGDFLVNTGQSADIWVKSADSQLPGAYSWIEIEAEIYQRYLEGYEEDGVVAELWGIAKSTVDKNDDVIEYLGRKYSNLDPDSGNDLVSDTAPQDVNFAYLEQEEVLDVFPEIAWQGEKGIRRSINSSGENTFDLLSISTPTAPVFAFTDSNVLSGSVSYSFTPFDEVITQINATAIGRRYNVEPTAGGRKKNKIKYGEKPYDADFYIYVNKSDVSATLDFWINRLSQVRRTVGFSGFLDAFGLEVWDRVSIAFSDPTFYDTTKGVPFNNVHAATPISWQSEGFVREIIPRLQEGLVDFIIELDSVTTESPDQNIREILP